MDSGAARGYVETKRVVETTVVSPFLHADMFRESRGWRAQAGLEHSARGLFEGPPGCGKRRSRVLANVSKAPARVPAHRVGNEHVLRRVRRRFAEVFAQPTASRAAFSSSTRSTRWPAHATSSCTRRRGACCRVLRNLQGIAQSEHVLVIGATNRAGRPRWRR